MARAGTLWLIVGPSGVGKDSLIDGARAALAGDARYAFAQREITRPADAGGEDHVAITMGEFEARRTAGTYALSWTANGLGYGVPRSIEKALGEGRAVVLNGSRGALGDARARYPGVRVVAVTVPPEVLRARLTTRGRETPEEIEKRLERAATLGVSGEDVIQFSNDRPLEESVAALVLVLSDNVEYLPTTRTY